MSSAMGATPDTSPLTSKQSSSDISITLTLCAYLLVFLRLRLFKPTRHDWDARIGAVGERVAAMFLKTLSHQIITRNWRSRGEEIDIICRKGSTLFFVEVKSSFHPHDHKGGSNSAPFHGGDTRLDPARMTERLISRLTPRKELALRRGARKFIRGRHLQLLRLGIYQVRFAAVHVQLSPLGISSLSYVTDIFPPDEPCSRYFSASFPE